MHVAIVLPSRKLIWKKHSRKFEVLKTKCKSTFCAIVLVDVEGLRLAKFRDSRRYMLTDDVF